MSIHSAESHQSTGVSTFPKAQIRENGNSQTMFSLLPGLILLVADVLFTHGSSSSREMAEQRGSFSHSLLSVSLRNVAGLEAGPGEEAGPGITECLR